MAFTGAHNLPVEESALADIETGPRYLIEDGPFSVFDGTGIGEYPETGVSAGDYVPDLVGRLLNLLEADNWRLDVLQCNYGSQTISIC